MLVLLIILCTILLFLMAVLVAPFIFQIDTTQGVYSFRIRGIFAVYLFSDSSNPLLVHFRVFAIPFNIDFLKKIVKSKSATTSKEKKGEKPESIKKKKSEDKKKTDGKKTYRLIRKYVPKILKTFKIKKLQAEIDTENTIINGLLTAFQFYINKNNIDITINYSNKNSLKLIIKNRLINPGWILLQMAIRK